MNKILRQLWCLLIVLLVASVGWACRYTVRDIGFVELRGPEYSLVVTLSSPHGAAEAALSSVDADIADWLSIVRRRLDDSNIRLSVMFASPDMGSDSQPKEGRSTILGLQLISREGQKLELESRLPLPGLAHAIAGDVDAVQASSQDAGEPRQGVEETVDSWLQHTLFSEVLDELGRGSIDAFVQILVIDGEDPRGNQVARDVAEQAAQAIRKIEPMLPRPIAFPVRIRHVPLQERQQEAVLLWALGDTASQGTTVSSGSAEGQALEPVLAVLYGRGRLAGPVMVGKDIELHETLSQLALVGESCECETDRAWMDERVLPFRWSKDLRQQASQSLGFDPDSPLVQAEMTRIVSQGYNSATAARKSTHGSDDIERLLLGYVEAELIPYQDENSRADVVQGADSAGSDSVPQTLPSTTALSPVRAQVLAGDGWGFDETVQSGPTVENAAAMDRAAKMGELTLEPEMVRTESHAGRGTSKDVLGTSEQKPAGGLVAGARPDSRSNAMGGDRLWLTIGVTFGVLFALAFFGSLFLARRS